jgi:heme-degrading monooxygenase HmoA
MIRVMYRWTVEPGDEEIFRGHWEEGTRRIQSNCAGALGSILVRSASEPRHFFGLARWESRVMWNAAQQTIIKLKLPGPLPESVRFFDEWLEIVAQEKD